MTDDHLDKETSLSAEITPTGVKASAKSRTIAAIDRLVGNLIEQVNAPLEARVEKIRALTKLEAEFKEVLRAKVIENIRSNPDFYNAALNSHFDAILRQYQNKIAVIEASLENLRLQPPTNVESEVGKPTLDEDFLNRFEHYAKDATTEQLRQRWGQILAAEIRRPGVFSNKILRLIDEIDPDVAILFEEICSHRIDRIIPKCLCGPLTENQTSQLFTAGLIVDAEVNGQFDFFEYRQAKANEPIWFKPLLHNDLIIHDTASIVIQWGHYSSASSIVTVDGTPAIPIYTLTKEALLIASILEDNQLKAEENYILKFGHDAPQSKFTIRPHQ